MERANYQQYTDNLRRVESDDDMGYDLDSLEDIIDETEEV